MKRALDPSKSPVEWALDFLWNRPEVSLVLSGMSSMDMVRQNVEYADQSGIGMLGESDLQMLKKARLEYLMKALVPCTNAVIVCLVRSGWISRGFMTLITRLPAGRKAGLTAYERLEIKADACRACGKCTKACPQKIEAKKFMRRIHEFFETMKRQAASKD